MSHIDTLLLLALPASGKSELRRYLAELDLAVTARDFHLGPTVQLDDYPYVQLMLTIDRELQRAGAPGVFFTYPSSLLIDARDWGALARLLREDYANLGTRPAVPDHPTYHLLDRYDRARRAVGAPPVTARIDEDVKRALAGELDDTIASFLAGLSHELGRYDESATVVVELARGGPVDATFPLTPPDGYAYTLPHLGSDMLARASVLYIWVTPEESRRRNLERAGPGLHEEASVLHHRVPDQVMLHSYGTDDLRWLIEQGNGAVDVTNATAHRLPAAVFDNRADFTSFLRSDPATWSEQRVADLHQRLCSVFDTLAP